MAIYLLATLDTKGHEADFVRSEMLASGHEVVLMDTGAIGDPQVPADVTRAEVFRAADADHAQVVKRHDRGEAVTLAAQGATKLVAYAYAAGRVDGVVALGGSAGTTIGTSAMRALPIGVPKVMVSTLASGQVRQYVGDKDIAMFNSVVDIAGLNRISRTILASAAAAMAGMVGASSADATADKPLVAATMFGVTTPCIERAREVLSEAGYEVLVFHATGGGGQAMETLIRDGWIAGVLDITTTELADELVGGVLSAGPNRLTAAAKACVPQVVSVGATDMVNFHAPETIPGKFSGRTFYEHNPTVTLMRTTPDENTALGKEIAEKVSAASTDAIVILPLRGVSAIDAVDQPFDDPDAREALFVAIRDGLTSDRLLELDHHINDAQFAETAAHRLIEMMKKRAASTA